MAPPTRTRSINKSDSAQLRLLRKGSKKDRTPKTIQNKDPVSASRANAVIPGVDTAFKAFLSARFCAAIWAHVSDCDETFNYWDPLHYLIYGRGLQTWEYSPEFALRSYAYLLGHGVPAWFYNSLFKPNPMLVFYMIRCMLGLSCALVEVYFYKAVCREFGIQIGRLWLIFQLFSPGMFIASTAFLPSSFAMYFCSAALAAWWHQKYNLAVYFIAIAALLGWPFAALTGLPLCYDMVVRQKKIKRFSIWTAISAATILIPMTLIDSSYFGRIVIAPLNLIFYNVFTSHGPNLYGTEPLSYYFINGFLNFNVIWLLALITPIMLLLGYYFVPAKSKSTFYLPPWLSLAPFYLWLLVFLLQPHKEERFLYPIYLMVGLCGSISLDVIQKLFFRIKTWHSALPPGTHYLDHTMWISAIVMIISTTLGLSRIVALYYNYHAPLDLMMELNTFYRTDSTFKSGATYNVCVGKDWYRYPNSFFLPSEQFRIRFLKSEFKGILPAYFSEHENGTAIVHPYFNDMNREEEAMYFDYEHCNFIFDLDVGRYSELEPNYAGRTKEWTVLKSLQFVNSADSHPLFRSFYVPYFSNLYVSYGNFNLLQKKSTPKVIGNENKRKMNGK